jgi:hypothetical protein
MANPGLEERERAELVKRLMVARRSVREAKQTADGEVEPRLMALTLWWDDGSPDFNRHMARNTPYAGWYASI